MAVGFDFQFEWDIAKAASNQRKHQIAFELAATVFYDPLMISVIDTDHEGSEERWRSIGLAENNKVLVVIHTHQEISETQATVRIISARLASKHEQRQYEVII